MVDSSQYESIRRLQQEMSIVAKLRARAQSLRHISSLVEPNAVYGTKVSIRKGQIFHRRGSYQEPSEIDLSPQEREEFSIWCKERSEKYKLEADERELKIAQEGVKA